MDIESLYNKYLECDNQLSIDSRSISPGGMFFAIRGERFDGNTFVSDVLDQKKAKYAVIDDPKAERAKGTILVDDCLETLQLLATRHRRSFDIPIIAITGSNGKTTTKELINSVLQTKYKVHATQGNYNNHLGVPLTILAAQEDTDIMVVEMGANHIGEIADLCIIAEPNYGIITNIGKAHLEGFGSLEGVVTAKTELYKYIAKKQGLIFYNASDKLLFDQLPHGVHARRYRSDIEFKVVDMKVNLAIIKDGSKSFHSTELNGSYNYPNISCAMTIAEYFSIPDKLSLSAVCTYTPSNNRSQITIREDVTLILDAYNANPSSMQKSIESLASSNSPKDKVLLLGDMKELGPESISLHKGILEIVKKYKWKRVILVGKDFLDADVHLRYQHYENVEALSKSKKEILTMLHNSICLVKASRSLKLEQIVAFFD